MTNKLWYLQLADGTVFQGYSFGSENSAEGEVVFNTAMTGYPESLTDPSYKGQILVLTYPLVGNYGVPEMELSDGLSRLFESEKVHISGLVVSEYSFRYSHWQARKSLSEWLKEFDVPGIYGVDTRYLTQKIRHTGTIPGKISMEKPGDWQNFKLMTDQVEKVSCKKKFIYGRGQYKILLVDCGVKHNIIRCLLKEDTTIIRVPWDYDFSREEYDGLIISNGPGDPKNCLKTIKHIQKALTGTKPIFGICLGHQLLALAAGGDTYKLKFGHRGYNQPVICASSDKAFITSQNHGYAVENNSLPPDWMEWFTNLNDNTNEGIHHRKKPFFSVQFHPEASGGPSDTEYLFSYFIQKIKEWKN